MCRTASEKWALVALQTYYVGNTRNVPARSPHTSHRDDVSDGHIDAFEGHTNGAFARTDALSCGVALQMPNTHS
jgi:hypothetical protein